MLEHLSAHEQKVGPKATLQEETLKHWLTLTSTVHSLIGLHEVTKCVSATTHSLSNQTTMKQDETFNAGCPT